MIQPTKENINIMNTDEKLLEAICEAIRLRRRYGMKDAPKFPTPFDTSLIRYEVGDATNLPRIELDVIIDGVKRKFDFVMLDVNEHGDLNVHIVDMLNELDNGTP